MKFLELSQLICSFGTFCDDTQSEVMSKHHYSCDNFTIVVDVHIRDKRAVNLESIDWEATKVVQGRVSCSEVVYAQTNTKSFKIRKNAPSFLNVGHGHGFGKFQVQTRGIELSLLENRKDLS